MVIRRLWCLLVATAAVAGPAYRWSPVGLGGGGTVIAPAISPHDDRLMFAGCDMSGAYRSTDGGATWTMLPGLQIRRVHGYHHNAWAFSPTDPQVVFAGTAEGLVRSADAGVSWSTVTGPWGAHGPEVVRFDRGRPGVGLAAMNGAGAGGQGVRVGVFLTRDGGLTWAGAAALPGVTGAAWGAVFDTRQPGTVIVGCEKGVFRSPDDGATWARSTAGLERDGQELSCFRGASAGAKTMLYATVPSRPVGGKFTGGVYRSADGGRTWQAALKGLNTHIGKEDDWSADIASYDFLAASDADPRVAYVSGTGTRVLAPNHATIYRTTDGGESWAVTLWGDPRMTQFNCGPDWIVQWKVWGWGYSAAEGLGVSEGNPNVVLRADAGGLLRSTDGGRHWAACHAPALVGGALPSGGMNVTTTWNYTIDPLRPTRHFISYTDVGFARSEDSGATWTQTVAGSPWRNTFYQLAVDPTVPDRMWAAASNTHDIPYWRSVTSDARRFPGGIVRSDDGGKTWVKTGEGGAATDIWLDPDSPAEARQLWVAIMGHGVFWSGDGGQTWQNRSQGLELERNPNVVRVRRGPDRRMYALVTLKYDPNTRVILPGGLFASADGRTWQRVNTGQDLWHPCEFALDPRDPKVIYVACQEAPAGKSGGGLWKTTDGGRQWQRVHHTGPHYGVTLDPRDPRRVYDCTYGDGIWTSDDAGATWSRLAGLPFLQTHRITFDPVQPGVIYVTTFGGGVWMGIPQ